MKSKIIFTIILFVVLAALAIYLNLNYVVPAWLFFVIPCVVGIVVALFVKPSSKPKKGDRHDF